MNSAQQMAVTCALQKMLEQGHFSICTIDQILKITGGIADKDDYSTLNLLHCVHYDKMPRELLAELPNIIERVINAPDLFSIMAQAKGFQPAQPQIRLINNSAGQRIKRLFGVS